MYGSHGGGSPETVACERADIVATRAAPRAARRTA